MGPTENPHKPIPCIFVNIEIGCKDYYNRPEDPCKKFKCQWITNEDIPENLKPNLSMALPIKGKTQNNNIDYLMLVEAGDKIDPAALSWYIGYALSNNINFAWKVNGFFKWMGSPEFRLDMEKENA